jgi:hypothetical protein
MPASAATPPVRPIPVPLVQHQAATVFWLVDAAGTVWPFGGAAPLAGAPKDGHLGSPVVDMVTTANGEGYWLVTADGVVLARGDAHLYSSRVPGPPLLTSPVVDLAATPTGHGYWLVTANGDVYTYGDAHFFGTASLPASAGAAVRLVPTDDGDGYWVVTAGGSVYSFGDARTFGSALPDGAAGPVVDMAATPDDQGYWLLTAAGAVYGFGDARYFGSSPVKPGRDPAEKIVSDAAGDGYWVVDQNGTAVALGAAGTAPPTQGLLFSPVTTGDRAVLFACSQLGKPYIWGGIGPKGFDCSGLAYRSWFVATGSWIPRESKYQYHGAGTPAAWDDLQAGDLIFWGSNQRKWQSVYHTAMYVGGSQIVESTADTVQLNTVFQWGATDLMGHGMDPAS